MEVKNKKLKFYSWKKLRRMYKKAGCGKVNFQMGFDLGAFGGDRSREFLGDWPMENKR